jgi:RNA polymerase sigma-70 factor, ECF subfamily
MTCDAVLADRLSRMRNVIRRRASRFFGGADLDDVVSEVIIKLWFMWQDQHRAVPDPRSIRPWLRTVVSRLCIDELRRRKRRRAAEGAAWSSSWSTDEESILLSRELSKSLLSGLNRIATKHRRILILHYVHGETVPTVARLCGIPLGTASSRIQAALVALRKELRRSPWAREDIQLLEHAA